MRLLGYVRVSSAAQQAHGHSLDDQPERLAAYCQAYGYQLVDVISEQVSARKVPLHKREGGAQLLARLEAGDADGVIVIKLDRLFRDLMDGLEYFRDALYPRRRGRAGRGGAQVVSLSEHIDTSTAAGRHMLKFALLEADAEADRTSERTADAMRGLRKRGRVYGHVPYGCVGHGGTWDAEQGRMVNQRLLHDPATWPIRETIVARRAGGDSLRKIRAWLAEQGIAAPSGGAKWSLQTISDLVDRHPDLLHLPLFDDTHAAAAAAPAHDPARSHPESTP